MPDAPMTPAAALSRLTGLYEGRDILDSLRELGFVVVPIEPDPAALERMARALSVIGDDDPDRWWPDYAADARAAYVAMVTSLAPT